MTPPSPEAPRTVLDLLAEAEERATAGPWDTRDDPGSSYVDLYMHHHFAATFTEADAALIALLRNHAAELIAVARAVDDLRLWEPGRAGYAAAFSNVTDALRPLLADAPEVE